MDRPLRKIIHVDMDAFYASVEQRDHPELRGRPVIVGGRPGVRGVVAACSYEARRFGVHSAMPASQAQRLCPDAVFVPPRMGHYAEISTQIREVFQRFTDRIEPLSLDEAYLDVTENKRAEPFASKLAKQIKREVLERTGLVASAGVGPCKLVAKIASDLDKPDGLLVIAPDQVLDFLAPLPVTRIWGVGPATAERLYALGVKTIADVRRLDAKLLEQRFGRYGVQLLRLANGDDTREVEARTRRKSCGSETTFAEDVISASELCHVLKGLCEDVAAYLEPREIRARTVTIKLRYDDFTTITRSRSLARAVSSAEGLFDVAQPLLLGSTEAGQRPVRLIGVSAGTLLAAAEPEQLWFDWSRM